jgi:Dolichyl-phosphate-mannose-protein mannosyltransferase
MDKLEKGPVHISCVIILTLVFFFILTKSHNHVSVTVDEFAHLPAGYAYLMTADPSWLVANPPSQRVIAALPLLFRKDIAFESPVPQSIGGWFMAGKVFMDQNKEIYIDLFLKARLAVCVLAALTGLCVYWFARQISGPKAGLVALFLFSFSPDFLAHGGLVTTDLSVALTVLSTMMCLFCYIKKRSAGQFIFLCLGVSLMTLSKFTSVVFLPIIFFILVYKKDKKTSVSKVFLEFLTVCLFCWIAVMAAYGFQGLFIPLGEMDLDSSFFSDIQKYFGWVPVPLPESLVRALDIQSEVGRNPWQGYLFGKTYYGTFPLYYIVCMIFKWPLPLLLLFLFCFKKTEKPLALFTVLPATIFVIFISIFFSKQFGARFLLPVLALMIVFIASKICSIKFSKIKGALVCVLLVWYAAGTLLAYPNYISYFNELGGGPRVPHSGHKILDDSNIDWGQDLPGLAKWQKEKGVKNLHTNLFGMVDPSIYGVVSTPASCPLQRGYTAVSVNHIYSYDEANIRSRCFAELADVPPIAEIGGSIRIYFVP